MTKTQLAVLKKALASAQRRASSTAEEGEKLWLHTYIIPKLEQVIGRRSVVETQETEADPEHNVCVRTKR